MLFHQAEGRPRTKLVSAAGIHLASSPRLGVSGRGPRIRKVLRGHCLSQLRRDRIEARADLGEELQTCTLSIRTAGSY